MSTAKRLILVSLVVTITIVTIFYYSRMAQREYDASYLRVAVASVQSVSKDRASFYTVLNRLSPLLLHLFNRIEKGHGYWKNINSAYMDMAIASFYMKRYTVSLKYTKSILDKYHPWSSESFNLLSDLWLIFGDKDRSVQCSRVRADLLKGAVVEDKKRDLCLKGK